MNVYDYVSIAEIIPGDHIHLNGKVMMVYAIKVDLSGRLEVTLLLPEETNGDEFNAVVVAFGVHEGVLKVNAFSDTEDEDEDEDGDDEQ